MKYATVCSGIEAPTVAWHPLGWKPVWFSEIDRFPSAVLNHNYPDTPNLGDMTKIYTNETFKKSRGTIDLFCGGTPCQSFSVAGLRKGMDDPRGNLALVFLGIVDRLRPRWVVWENVPGVLSSNGGRDFGTFIGALGLIGYGWAYRVLDAQYFGIPQRRRRVFVIGYLGDWRRAAAVLFERSCMSGHPPPCRESGQGFAGSITSSLTACGGKGNRIDKIPHFPVANPLGSHHCPRNDLDNETFVATYDLRGRENGAQLEGPYNTANIRASSGGSSRSYVFQSKASASQSMNPGEISPSIDKAKGEGLAVWSIMPQNSGKDYKAKQVEVTQPLMGGGPVSGNQGGDYIQDQLSVRRLTPRECERLQGFPDDYTLIDWTSRASARKITEDMIKYFRRAGYSEENARMAAQHPDGPRYKALGNSMAVPVIRWIGERIEMVEKIK